MYISLDKVFNKKYILDHKVYFKAFIEENQEILFKRAGQRNLDNFNAIYFTDINCTKETCRPWVMDPILRKLTNDENKTNLYAVNLFDCEEYRFSNVVPLKCLKEIF